MRAYGFLLVLLFSGVCFGQSVFLHRGQSVPFSLSRLRRGAEQDFWSMPSINYNSGGIEAGYPVMDIPVNDVSDKDLDKIQVVSSAIRVLPKNDRTQGKRRARQVSWRKPRINSQEIVKYLENNAIRRKRETVQSWRRPRQHQFVTNKADRLPPPPIVRVYPPVDRNERFFDRDYRKSQRRIIYYANLPEIVRPPVQWYNTRGDYYNNLRQGYSPSSSSLYSSSPYPSPSENEITRVQSNIIDVTNSRYTGHSSSPKFTIIDVEPPYNYQSYNRRPPVRYNPYPSSTYTPNRFYNDFRNPPYRDPSNYPSQNFRPDIALEPVKLQIPTTDFTTTANTTDIPANTTRFLPDSIPVSLRSLAKFVT